MRKIRETARTSSCLEDLVRDIRLLRIEPRLPAPRSATLWALLELGLPGGMKDRVALQVIEDAEASGALQPGATIVESSSGTMAEGLARIGRLRGYPVIIVTDPRIDELTRAKLQALGAELRIVEEYDENGGWQSARLRELRRVLRSVPGAFWSCQYDNPSNGRAYHSVGRAIIHELGSSLAALVGAVGSGGSLCGMGSTLRQAVPDLSVIAVDAAGSVLFHQPDRKRLQSGHGNSIVPGNLRYKVIDEVHWLSDAEVFHGCRELARRTGIFAGGSSGATYVVASWVAAQLPPHRHVVAIFPDRGDRYYRTIFSDRYWEEHGLAGAGAAGGPRSIRYGEEVAETWSRATLPHSEDTPLHAEGVVSTAALARDLGLEAGSW